MLLLLCDETNVDPRSDGVEFFVYGGLIVESTDAHALHLKVAAIREKYGFGKDDLLKWQSSSRPRHVEVQDWNAAKEEVLQAAAAVGCALVVVVINHNIAKGNEERHTWQMDALVQKFNALCLRNDAAGMVLVDRLDGQLDEFSWMQSKLTSGLTWSGSGYTQELARIVLYGVTSVKASYLTSALDIALGAFAYCINERRPDRVVPRKLMPLVEPLLLGRKDPDRGTVNPLDQTLILRPKTSTAYRRSYVELLEHVEELSVNITIGVKDPPYD